MPNSSTYIERVQIKGLWDLYDIDWKLDPKVNILAGANGTGKSTILNLIYAYLIANSLPFNFKQITTIDKKDYPQILYTALNKNKYSFKESTLHININNSIKRGKLYSNYKADTLSTNLAFTKIDTFDTVLKDKSILKNGTKNEIKTGLDIELHEAINEFKSYQLTLNKQEKEQVLIIEKEIKNILEQKQESSEKLLVLYQQKEKIQKEIYAQKDLCIDIINKLFAVTNKTVDFDANNTIIFQPHNIRPYQLSSGEKQMLLILLQTVVQQNKPHVLLMDEPEVSLHADWQENLIDYIQQLNPNCQIILVTHSPDIIVKGWLDKVTEMEDILSPMKHEQVNG